MAFAVKTLQHLFKNHRMSVWIVRLWIGCGIFIIVMGVSILIIANNAGRGYILHPGIGYILMGISCITIGLLEQKPKLMVTCTIVALGLALWILIFKPGDETAKGTAIVQQESVEIVPKPKDIPSTNTKDKASKTVAVRGNVGGLDALKRIIPPELHDHPTTQQMMLVLNSDSFQDQVKKQGPLTPQEYIDLMVAHGVTGFADLDVENVLAEGQQLFENAYKAANSDKAPEEEDEAMAKRFGEVLKEYGLRTGLKKLTADQENVLWINARFKGDEAAFNEWWGDVVAVYESDDSARASPIQRDSEFPFGEFFDTPSDGTPLDIPLIETERGASEHRLSEMWEDPTIPGTDDRNVTPPTVDPEKIVTKASPDPPALPTAEEIETTLKERFSSERIYRAMDTLERYGEEEGLRRLRESDPEIARQMEQRRDREDKESVPSRRGGHE